MRLTNIESVSLSPLDGRYKAATSELVEYLSESALNRERMRTEAEWMILLAGGIDGKTPVLNGVSPFTEEEKAYLRSIPEDFGEEGIKELAQIESVTHHDVKAVEYYIDARLEAAEEKLSGSSQLSRLKPLVHFACTSEEGYRQNFFRRGSFRRSSDALSYARTASNSHYLGKGAGSLRLPSGQTAENPEISGVFGQN